MKFSIIIPTYNDWERLLKCLKALEKQTLAKGRYEVIVVDNSKTGKVPDRISLPDWVQFVHEPEPGSYSARNKGADKAIGEVLAFTDSDCVPDKHWLAKAEARFDTSTCDLLGGKVKIFQNEEGNKYGFLYERVTAFPQHKNVPKGKGVTANLFIKKSVFDTVGGFRSTLKSGGDWEFTLRCTQKGYEMIYCEEVLVWHPARTLPAILKKQKRMACGGAADIKERYGHSYLRILGSHLIHVPNYKRENMPEELSRSEKIIIYAIDTLKYFYRIVLFSGMMFRFIDPNRVRE
ncbi:glycosyltransferase family 2 protein [Fodinibius salsisoli]|uniref:Glycosyltransferase n=1 Tax=Fodinibius salsisoli TaxID=2820877 RepID=A0ABT3PLD1_9BACT|nr:glycosyltransferase [Fodinibius salsisoli]MCW9706759.1 glycosyltransferase [Fodinibius salsisoli]